MSWSGIFPDLDEPVLGSTEAFRAAESQARRLEETSDRCTAEFAKIRASGALGELRGRTADQLVDLIAAIDGSLGSLAPAFHDLADVFDRHAGELADLHRSAQEALARAATRWDDLRDARDRSAEANWALAAIERQIRDLRRGGADDPAGAAELADLEQRRRWADDRVNARHTAVADAEAALDDSRAEHGRLADAERELVEGTVWQIRWLDLGDLRDRNRVMAFIGGVGSFLVGVGTGAIDAVTALAEAIVTGEWGELLWRLSDLLAAAIDVLTVVGIALAIFTTGGVAVGLIVGVMVAKLAVDTALATTGQPHPDTGRPLTWGEVAVDAVMVAVTAVTADIGSRLIGPSARSTAARRSAVANVRNLFRPTGLSGRPLAGAAVAPARRGSWRQLGAETIDHLVGPTVEFATEAVVGRVVAPGPAGQGAGVVSGPGVPSGAWTHPAMIASAGSAPARDALRRIEAAVAATIASMWWGPTSDPQVARFQIGAVR